MSISISGSSYGQQGYSSINVNSKQYEGKYRSAMYAAVKAATDANESLNLRITEHYVIPNPDPELLEFI